MGVLEGASARPVNIPVVACSQDMSDFVHPHIRRARAVSANIQVGAVAWFPLWSWWNSATPAIRSPLFDERYEISCVAIAKFL